MLENKSFRIRKSKEDKVFRTVFVLTTVLLFALIAILIPFYIELWSGETVPEVSAMFRWNIILTRTYFGLVPGILFSLYGLKKFRQHTMVQIIRIFLVTFILFLSITYIATKT